MNSAHSELDLFQWIRLTEKKITILDFHLYLFLNKNYSFQGYLILRVRLLNSLSSAISNLSLHLPTTVVLLDRNDPYNGISLVINKIISLYLHISMLLQV